MINNSTAKSTYTVTDVSLPYAIGFVFQYNTDGTPQIMVYKNKLSATPLVYNTNYKISDDGLSIVLLSGVEVGDRIDIIRNIPLKQQSSYHVGRIDPEQIETNLDLAVERDQQIQANIDFIGEVPEDHEARIQALEQDVDDIEDLIPTQTTTENQLADKNFVNSSIATSTATFRGTYDSLVELEAVTADANDYGFVVSVDAAGNTLYSRYKYDGTNWVFEYNLNNSSFTSDQWAAINSGITSALVAMINSGAFVQAPELFDFKWKDCLSARTDWAKADGSWVEGKSLAYQQLASDIDGKTLQSETIGSTTVQFYLADNGRKICPVSEETNVDTIYAATGIGWYYIIDTANQKFKLPRTKFGFVGLRDTVGKYVEPELPDHTHTYKMSTGSVLRGSGSYGSLTSDTTTFNSGKASASNSIYKDDVDATVQQPATQMYLYFYVGPTA